MNDIADLHSPHCLGQHLLPWTGLGHLVWPSSGDDKLLTWCLTLSGQYNPQLHIQLSQSLHISDRRTQDDVYDYSYSKGLFH